MPYYRKYKKRYPRRRRNGRKSNSLMSAVGNVKVGDIARAAYRGVKYLRGLVNSEMYHYDTAISANINNTGSVYHLTAIAQGDGDGARTGNSVLVKKITYSESFNLNASATTSWLRKVIVMDNQQVGDTTPSFTDIFDTTNGYISALLNKSSLGRYTIIRDKVYTMDNSSKKNLQIRGSIPWTTHVRFNGSASSDIQKNGIYVFYVSNEATNTVPITCNYRVHYHDN